LSALLSFYCFRQRNPLHSKKWRQLKVAAESVYKCDKILKNKFYQT